MGPRTDYTDKSILDQRLWQAGKRRDHKLIHVHRIKVKFDSAFDVFAANAAHELRTKLYYRTDGGKNARGLVRASGDLEKIHQIFLTASPRTFNGTLISLNAILVRRQDPMADLRWTMSIRFNNSDDIGFVDGDLGEFEHEVDVSTVQERLMRMYLGHAQIVAGKMAGPKGDRIRKMLAIADRIGYPRNWDLAIYTPDAVYEFMDYRIQQPDEETNPRSRRRVMTSATGGSMPFTGNTGGPQHADWQIFPIRQLALECAKKPTVDDCDATMHNELKQAEAAVEQTFTNIFRRQKEVSSIPPSMNPFDLTPTEANLGPMAFKFHKHLLDETNNRDSLYSAWK